MLRLKREMLQQAKPQHALFCPVVSGNVLQLFWRSRMKDDIAGSDRVAVTLSRVNSVVGGNTPI
ncbi:unnamed protein product [Leuciscus chuanchicus]